MDKMEKNPSFPPQGMSLVKIVPFCCDKSDGKTRLHITHHFHRAQSCNLKLGYSFILVNNFPRSVKLKQLDQTYIYQYSI